MRTKLLSQVVSISNKLSRGFGSSSRVMAPIKVGDTIPNVDLFEGTPGDKRNTMDDEIFGKGTHVIFAIPGAFTPTCQEKHFPTFTKSFKQLTDKGAKVWCISVNDPFVMAAFKTEMKTEIRCLADTCGAFTKAIDLQLDAPGIIEALGNVRSQRYSMVVKDGKVTAINIEPDSGKATCSNADEILAQL